MLPHMEGLTTGFVPPRFLQETYNEATHSLSQISHVKMLKLLCTLLFSSPNCVHQNSQRNKQWLNLPAN